MEIGYSNSDIEFYLEEKRNEKGELWSIVTACTKTEWENIVRAVKSAISLKLGETISDDVKKILSINGGFSTILSYALEEDYPEAQLLKDFVYVCGDKIHPSMSMQEIDGERIAVIYHITRAALKENMSPRRNIDAG